MGRQILRVWSSGCLLLLILGCSRADDSPPSVVGRWVGVTHLDISVYPPPQTKDQKAILDEIIDLSRKARTELDLDRDGTYTMTAHGVPKISPKSTKSRPILITVTRVSSGKWSLSGHHVVLLPGTVDGKALDNLPEQSLAIDDDWITLTLVPQGTGQYVGLSKVVFKRRGGP